MNDNVQSRYPGVILTAIVWVSFFTCGILVWNQVSASHVEGVFGYDYMLYVRQLSDVNWITYTGVRHPGLGFVLSPIVLCGKAFSFLGESVREIFFVAFFAMVAAVNLLLVRHIAGWIASALFLSFGWTWVLGSVPESFPIAMMSLLLVLVLIDSRIGGMVRWITWGTLFFLSSAVTVTNGLKVVIAFLLTENCSRKVKRSVICGLAILALIGILYFYIRLELWNVAHPEMQKSVSGALSQTFNWIPHGMGALERIKAMVVNFFLIPVVPIFSLPVESSFVLRNTPPIGCLGWVWGVCIYLAASVALWKIRDCRLAKAMCGMFVVDVAIHLACGWGLQEGWLFSAHWFFMIPIMIGLAVQRSQVVVSSP